MTIDASQFTAHKHPGKFEGETPASEYFYNLMCEGYGETIFAGDYAAELFEIDAKESETFGLEHGHWFMLTEDSQGFVVTWTFETRKEAEEHFSQWAGPSICDDDIVLSDLNDLPAAIEQANKDKSAAKNGE